MDACTDGMATACVQWLASASEYGQAGRVGKRARVSTAIDESCRIGTRGLRAREAIDGGQRVVGEHARATRGLAGER